MMRRHEKDFMLRGGDQYGTAFNKRIEEFEKLLGETELEAKAKDELTSLLGSYRQSFMAYMAQYDTLKEEADDLATIYDRLKPVLVAVKDAADQRYTETLEVAAQSRLVVSITIGAVVLLRRAAGRLFRPGGYRGRCSAWSRPWDQMAGGRLDVEMQETGRRDEIGRMANALLVFRAMRRWKRHGSNRPARSSGSRRRSSAGR